MELSERWLKKFEEENFASVYEWQDPADTCYPEHTHKGKISLFRAQDIRIKNSRIGPLLCTK